MLVVLASVVPPLLRATASIRAAGTFAVLNKFELIFEVCCSFASRVASGFSCPATLTESRPFFGESYGAPRPCVTGAGPFYFYALQWLSWAQRSLFVRVCANFPIRGLASITEWVADFGGLQILFICVPDRITGRAGHYSFSKPFTQLPKHIDRCKARNAKRMAYFRNFYF